MDKDKVHIFLLTSGKPCVYFFMLFLLFLLVTSKKSKFLKSITCLGKAIPCPIFCANWTACHIYFSFINYTFCTFFTFSTCTQSTCMMSLASTLASTGDYFFYFFAKKYKKQEKSMISKHKVFLM